MYTKFPVLFLCSFSRFFKRFKKIPITFYLEKHVFFGGSMLTVWINKMKE